MIRGWTAEALNTAPDSANQIHGDEIAKQYGFQGGLVPGVTISAYLIQPAIESWGMKWLRHGAAHVRVGSPLYDGERFLVDVLDQTDTSYRAELSRPDGTVSATAEVALPGDVPTAPERRMDPIVDKDYKGPKASFDTFTALRNHGCKAFRYRWNAQHRMQAYVRDEQAMPPLLSATGDGFANMSFLLGCSNWVLAGNAHMNPWVHLETRSQNYAPVPTGTMVVAEMVVREFYEKKGHEFVDVDVHLFDESDDTCLMTTSLRAIYRLRGM